MNGYCLRCVLILEKGALYVVEREPANRYAGWVNRRFDGLTTERTEDTEEGMSEIALHQLTERINFSP